MSAGTRREFLQAADATGAALIAPQLLAAPRAQAATTARPNLVFFLGEGARWDESSLAGNKILKTPNIDRIDNQHSKVPERFSQAGSYGRRMRAAVSSCSAS